MQTIDLFYNIQFSKIWDSLNNTFVHNIEFIDCCNINIVRNHKKTFRLRVSFTLLPVTKRDWRAVRE